MVFSDTCPNERATAFLDKLLIKVKPEALFVLEIARVLFRALVDHLDKKIAFGLPNIFVSYNDLDLRVLFAVLNRILENFY